jgi:KDO2-lipid IV(A) lauroyltransferase
MAEKRVHKRVKRFLRYYLLRALFAFVGALPLGAAKRLGAFVGGLGFVLARKERRKALDSLSRAFPQKSDGERLAIARACFRHLGTCGGEIGALARIDRMIERYVLLPDSARQVLEAALAERKGVVFVSGHVGNFELLARRISMAGFPCQTIAKEASDPRTTALIEKVRLSGKLKVIWRGQAGSVRHMLRALKNGEILGMLIDQDTKVQGVFVDFFGEKAFTPRAAADFALRTGAAVVMGFAFRREDGGYRLELTRLSVTPKGDRDADATELTAAMTRSIEDAIRRAPEAWVWMHQRWKTRPQ